MLTLKNLDDYREWPVKHRHWMFEVAEDEAHGIWIRTRDLRAFWEKFPADRELKTTHSGALLYAKDTKDLYISQRAMRQLLQRSKSHSFHPEVLKFLDWFDRNVTRVAEGKRTGERLSHASTRRAHQEQQVLLGPLRPGLASPQMEDSTLALSQEERWALAQNDPATPRVFHPEARIRRTTWREWLAQTLPALKSALGDVWRGHGNLWVTYALVAVLGALPAALLRAVLPESSDDWPAAVVRVLWGHMLVSVLSVALVVVIFVVITRCTRSAMRIVSTRWIALGMYCMALSVLPGLAVRNVDIGLADSWWGMVSGERRPVEVRADPQLGRIVLRGRVGFGSSEALEKVLLANRQLTLIELESPGGYAVEGFRMAELITRYGLDTVAFGDCASACTLLFAAGGVRHLGPDAELGFHRSGTKYGPVGEGWSATDHAMADYYAQRGVTQEFIHKALTPSIRDLWVAPHAEQYVAGYASLRWSERKSGY